MFTLSLLVAALVALSLFGLERDERAVVLCPLAFLTMIVIVCWMASQQIGFIVSLTK